MSKKLFTAKLREARLSSFFTVLESELSEVSANVESTSFAVGRQLSRARKRARFIGNRDRKELAIQGFSAANQQVLKHVCANASNSGAYHTCGLPNELVSNARHFIERALWNYTSSWVDDAVQTSLDLDLLFDFWRFGPGTSNGVLGTHAAQKISQNFTCTLSAYPLCYLLRRRNVYFSSFDGNESTGLTLVRGSRLSTVPKNEETERTIAIEPSGNMALQLAAGMYLEGALRYIGLDIRSQQEKNKLAAKYGSIENSLATIDLKSASDMISLELVRALLPADWYSLLLRLRSSEIEMPDGSYQELHMVSTMGNGFTFPLMTLVITAIIYAVRCTTGNPRNRIDWTKTWVFGDDIIIPSSEYSAVCTALEQAGLVVNHDKSFSDGPFRESCGGDYYKGVDVTPFYVKDLAQPSDVYVALNQVLEWSAKVKIMLPKTVTLLKSFLDDKVFLVPEWHGASEGVRCSSGPARYKYLKPNMRKRKVPLELRRQDGSLVANPFTMMLACGGYIEQIGSHLFYVPRCDYTQYVVRKLRRPKGYLSGADPLSRSAEVTSWIDTQVAILL